MRFSEFVREQAVEDSAVNLITALELLRHRYKTSDQPPKINTNSLINMVRNTDQNFDYNALIAANEIPAVQNLIKSFNKDEILINLDDPTSDVQNDAPAVLNVGGDEEEVDNVGDTDVVGDMAKKAAKRDGAPLA
jgi:hypothetical protein